ncbi:heptahelical transmembrane protein 2 [Ipomoea triloba]|uniref:heptahelical transmembrane protein 2 n=1 Tax=Ipomoea triloba TaxID=35885 RepID=UPI00125D6CFD|nr:heptahelical transmembrane protein 2 [Ipomoea triloba]
MSRRRGKGGAESRRLGNGDVDHRVDSVKEMKMKNHVKFERKLVKYEALPEYLQDNEFIRDYYRCEWPLKHIVLSVFSLHNETVNIWTHLLGSLLFVALTVMTLTEKASLEHLAGVVRPAATMISNYSAAIFPETYPRKFSKSPITLDVNRGEEVIPMWPWFVFLVGAMGCLVFSSVSHLFACHSQRCTLFFWRLDYSGISLMIVTSFFAPLYYIFSCHPHWRMFYLTSITIVGILAIITLLSPALSSGRFRSFRAALFLAMGFSGVIPATHATFLYRDHPEVLVALAYEIAMGFLYATGTALYVSRIPERLKPGAFDIVGSSHQIFHVFVVAAALAHSAATLVIMDWRRGLPACNATLLG